MAFSLKFSDTAARQFDALDPPLQKRVKVFLEDACALVDPAVRFERLHGKLSYRLARQMPQLGGKRASDDVGGSAGAGSRRRV